MAMRAVAWANGNSMHLLSDVEKKAARFVATITVSSSSDKLCSGIKGPH